MAQDMFKSPPFLSLKLAREECSTNLAMSFSHAPQVIREH